VPQPLDPAAELKKRAALAAVDEVRSGMRLGLGTGSTAAFAIEELGRRLAAGELSDLLGVPTSRRAGELAEKHGIPQVQLEQAPLELDLAIDGADEVDPNCDLIKGGGGALLMEKAVERRCARFICIVDEAKLSPKLGTRFALPVEVVRETWRRALTNLTALGARAELRGGPEAPYVTDRGNYIIDCHFRTGIDDPYALAARLDGRRTVAAHGLFLGMATEVIVASADGLRRLRPPRS
jgi:ribose 5-phosphate isomerase A